jgi:hypothetical protein
MISCARITPAIDRAQACRVTRPTAAAAMCQHWRGLIRMIHLIATLGTAEGCSPFEIGSLN